MDYEKKYNEALERAKAYHRNELAGSRREMTEYIFPELRESNDERIRKYLIEELKAAKSVGELKFIIPQPTREECIAYLEKQKEQKHPNGCFTCDEYKKGYEEGRRNGFTAGYNKAMKEVEQKEQKPAWSEEDKKHINLILRVLDAQWCWDGATGKRFNPYQDEIDWLKSLRPSWKPSEEQIDALKELIDDANRAGWVTPGATELYEELKKL